MASSGIESSLERTAENEKRADINAVYGLSPRSRDGGTHQELLQKLSTSSYYHVKNSNPQRIDGTCEWFASHPRFHVWRDSETASLLWVTGDSGCGKSVLSRYLADEVLRNLSLCYFFFKADVKEQSTAESALCCILRQLFEQRPHLLSDRIFQLFEDDGGGLRGSIRKLWRILVSAASQNKASQIVCILDGLDECQEESRRALVETLNSFFTESHTTPRLKALITSRTLSHPDRRLYKPESTIYLGREPQSDFGSLGAEIDLAASHRLAHLRVKLNMTRPEERRLNMEITKVSERTHLWVFLLLEYLASIPPAQLKESCTNLPTTLDEVYEKILSASPRPMKARKLLQIIVASVRPLTLTEMAVVLAIEEGHTSQSELDIEPADHFRNTLQRLCGPLVSVIDDRIYLFHQTLKTFLVRQEATNSSSETSLSSQATDSNKWASSIPPRLSNNLLGRICVQYLLFTDVEDYFQNPHSNIEKLRTKPLDSLSENYPFLGYAWENWAVHSRHPSSGDDDENSRMEEMLQLCSPHRLSTLIWLRRKWCHPKLDAEDVTRLIVASYLGLPEVARHLLRVETTDPNARDGIFGRSALSWAAGAGFEAVVKTFIDTQRAAKRRSFLERLLGNGGIQVDSKSKPPRTLNVSHRPCTPLGWAVRFGHEGVAKQLLATNQVKVDEKMLFDAARGGHLGIMQALLATGQVRADAKDLFKRTLLSWASESGHASTTKYLLSLAIFDIDARDLVGRTALTYAARSGQDQVLEQLLATGKVDVDARDNAQRTPLCCAAEHGHDVCVKLLLATGKADVNSRDERGETPLSLAVGQEREECVKLLLGTGKVNLDNEDYMGRTPLELALIRGYGGCIALLEPRQGHRRDG